MRRFNLIASTPVMRLKTSASLDCLSEILTCGEAQRRSKQGT